MADRTSQTTRSRPRSSYSDESDMISDLRERIAVVEVNIRHHDQMIEAQRHRVQSQTTRYELLEGRVTRNERALETHSSIVAVIPTAVDRVSRIEQAQDTSAKVKAAQEAAATQAAEQRKQAMALAQWVVGLLLLAIAAAKGVSSENAGQWLKLLGALVPGK